MKNTFSYSILQYKHSLLLKESLNVGLLFYFPDNKETKFVSSNPNRLKCIYPNFDQTIYYNLIKNIVRKVEEYNNSLFSDHYSNDLFKNFIHQNLLKEDATSLQFTEPFIAVDSNNDLNETVKKYSELFLPGLVNAVQESHRHNEQYILKRYIQQLTIKYKGNFNNRVSKDRVISYQGIKLKFDMAWQNGTLNFVKPVSFDLKEQQDIQAKSTTYFGYLTLLSEYAEQFKYRFDLLVAKPQNNELLESYNDALNVLQKAKSPKRIITEEQLNEYSEETVQTLIENSPLK